MKAANFIIMQNSITRLLYSFLACITLDLMRKERSRVPPEDFPLSHIKGTFEGPFKQVSSQALCWTLEKAT